jgi:hypothetical protein
MCMCMNYVNKCGIFPSCHSLSAENLETKPITKHINLYKFETQFKEACFPMETSCISVSAMQFGIYLASQSCIASWQIL